VSATGAPLETAGAVERRSSAVRAWARRFLALSRLPGRLSAGTRRLLDVPVLAFAPDALLDEITAAYYLDTPFIVSEEHLGHGLFVWERRAVDECFPPRGRILVTSAGAGREALALLQGGWSVVATECAEPLARALADRLGPWAESGRARALWAAPDHVPDDGGRFDAVVVGWTGYTHLRGRSRRLDFLRRLRSVLVPAGPLLLSFEGAPGGHPWVARAVAALAGPWRRALGREPVETGETLGRGGFTRVFAPGKAAAEVREAGMEVVREDWTGYPHLVARAPGPRPERTAG
jgi:SAM-dependent methyltransferase